MTFGNHDYRLNPYDLVANIDLPFESNDRGLNEYSSHNLMQSDALAIQDGKTPVYTVSNLEGAGQMIKVDFFRHHYAYFTKYFTRERTYTVRLGKHRLVVMDTKFDNGIPDDFDILTLLNLGGGGDGLFESQLGSGLPATKKLLSGGGPDSTGFSPDEINLLRNTIFEAGADGIVIVGMHCPAISPKGSEYAYFHRETIHPTADPALTDAYLERHEITDGKTWTRTGTPHFKAGSISDGMDAGVIVSLGQEFLEICAGKNQSRPVDLVLWGHHHDRVEYRIKRNNTTGNLEYYMDFYSENPGSYYHTINGLDNFLPKNAMLRVLIEPGTSLPVTISNIVNDHDKNITFGEVKTPPYADPLNASKDPKGWWNRHRPLLAQTSALGPIDPRQRYGKFFKLIPPPNKIRPAVETDGIPKAPKGTRVEELAGVVVQPTFQGFRLIQVRKGVIAKMRYVVLQDLRKDNFHTPWENDSKGGIKGPIHPILVDQETGNTSKPGKPTIGTAQPVNNKK